MTAVLQKRGDPKRALAAAYLLRIYITLDIMGYSVSLPVIAAGFDALEWYAVILVAGATATTIVSALSGRLTLLAGHAIAEDLHDALEAEIPDIKHVFIHVDPVEKKNG